MLIRTHLAINLLAILLFLPNVTNKIVFIIVALIATLLPDIDTSYSTIGKFKGFRILQFFIRHRGFFHSFTFCILIAILLAFFFPVLSLAFFLGYSLHLFADSFNLEGISPFWPIRKKSKWKIRTGSLVETNIFLVFLLIDLVVIVFLIKDFF